MISAMSVGVWFGRLFLVLVLIIVAVVFIMWHATPTFQTYPASDHYDPKTKRFFNTPKSIPPKSGTHKAAFDMIFSPQKFRPSQTLPMVATNWQDFLSASAHRANFVWFGHSTILARMADKTLLIDPVLADYASPVPIMAKRFAPKVDLSSLPNVDVIIYSHAHYDHLDFDVVRFYRDKGTRFVVPLGVGAYLKKWDIDDGRIVELDWWQAYAIDNLSLTAVPARHNAARTAFDGNRSLWAGWVIASDTERVYFSGDSAFGEHFAKIGERFGGFDLAFIENGQYNELWADNHLFPHETVQAVIDVKAKHWTPIHWGAYPLSTHAWDEPVNQSSRLSDEKALSIKTPNIGQVFNQDTQTQRWWQK